MKKITPAELREPDVTIELSYDQWAELPRGLREDLRPYGGKDTGYGYIIKVPAYAYRDMERQAEKVTTP